MSAIQPTVIDKIIVKKKLKEIRELRPDMKKRGKVNLINFIELYERDLVAIVHLLENKRTSLKDKAYYYAVIHRHAHIFMEIFYEARVNIKLLANETFKNKKLKKWKAIKKRKPKGPKDTSNVKTIKKIIPARKKKKQKKG